MKYAFIALVVFYLITYGCSPDNSEKATESHEQTAPAAVEHAPQSEVVAIPEQPQETVAPAEQHAAADAEHAAAVEAPRQPADVIEQPAEVVDTTDPILNFKVVEQAPGEPAIEAKQVIMPCGKMMALTDITENTPCLKPHWKAPQDATEPAQKTKDLATALQKMIDTTNDLMLATKQLVNVTQELLNTDKESQESTEIPQEAQPAKQ